MIRERALDLINPPLPSRAPEERRQIPHLPTDIYEVRFSSGMEKPRFREIKSLIWMELLKNLRRWIKSTFA